MAESSVNPYRPPVAVDGAAPLPTRPGACITVVASAIATVVLDQVFKAIVGKALSLDLSTLIANAATIWNGAVVIGLVCLAYFHV